MRSSCFEPGGLLEDSIRKDVWPMLLSVKKLDAPDDPIVSHKSYEQVALDVARILKKSSPTSINLAEFKAKTLELIVKVLIQCPELEYFQGFHYVAATLQLVLGDDLSYTVLCHLARSHFHLCMQSDMKPVMRAMDVINFLIEKKNPKLYEHLLKAKLGTVVFLPWVVTWFGHVIDDYSTIVRLYDVFISSHYYSVMYLSAVIVMHRADELLSTPCDMPQLHEKIAALPANLPFDDLLVKTRELMDEFPPEMMDNRLSRRARKVKKELNLEPYVNVVMGVIAVGAASVVSSIPFLLLSMFKRK